MLSHPRLPLQLVHAVYRASVELTESYKRVFPAGVLGRYDFVEVRNAAATFQGSSPAEFNEMVGVLERFKLTLDELVEPGGNKTAIAKGLDDAFRVLGWREAGHKSETIFRFQIQPWKEIGETEVISQETLFTSGGHKVDNFKGRIALDCEWNAKDGNLDRDLANFRALHDAALIDVGVIITRAHAKTRWAANTLAELAGRIRYNTNKKRIVLLGTTTTTNLENLERRVARGDAGGCPTLVIAITDRCYEPGEGDPVLPPYEHRGELVPAIDEGESEPPEPD